MSLLKNLIPTPAQVQAVAEFESYCRAIRDATIVHTEQTAPDWKWQLWYESSERVRESGLDPLNYANAKRG